jgi:hypothetical protein
MTRTRVGDAMIGQGRVVGKRVENGEYLADLQVWLRNLRGNVSEAAIATVSLPTSKAGGGEDLAASSAAALTAPARVDLIAATTFQTGDRVRLRPRPDWPTPPGFRLAGAEGMVDRWVHYDDAMAEFKDVVVCVRINKAHGEGQVYVGNSLLFLPEDLEHV